MAGEAIQKRGTVHPSRPFRRWPLQSRVSFFAYFWWADLRRVVPILDLVEGFLQRLTRPSHAPH